MVELQIRAMNNNAMKYTIGMGSYSSLTIGLKPVKVLAQTLQTPRAVALLSMGKIRSSIKLAKYDAKKLIAIPNLAVAMQIGIHLLKKSNYEVLIS